MASQGARFPKRGGGNASTGKVSVPCCYLFAQSENLKSFRAAENEETPGPEKAATTKEPQRPRQPHPGNPSSSPPPPPPTTTTTPGGPGSGGARPVGPECKHPLARKPNQVHFRNPRIAENEGTPRARETLDKQGAPGTATIQIQKIRRRPPPPPPTLVMVVGGAPPRLPRLAAFGWSAAV